MPDGVPVSDKVSEVPSQSAVDDADILPASGALLTVTEDDVNGALTQPVVAFVTVSE